MLRNRKGNRLKGYDYSRNNVYFITNCVKNNVCCLGRVVCAGTGRDLSVQNGKKNPINNSNNSSENNPINPLGNQFIIHPIHLKNQLNNPSKNISAIPSQIPSENKYISQLNQFGLIVEERINWLSNQYEYVEIHNYVVMPNHFHLILEIDATKVSKEVKIKSVSSLIGALKSTASHQIRELGFQDFQWHRSFHDYIIRNDKAYQNISNYIDKNPEKWFEDTFFAKS